MDQQMRYPSSHSLVSRVKDSRLGAGEKIPPKSLPCLHGFLPAVRRDADTEDWSILRLWTQHLSCFLGTCRHMKTGALLSSS